ncbi:MAG TPA: hypothetical protein VMW91_02110 [Desulfosporosinus sp.]|nr:hypothetical protein [Desulfosporosinus sp.]
MMELEILNKLYLELSQIATAKTKREVEQAEQIGVLSASLELALNQRKIDRAEKVRENGNRAIKNLWETITEKDEQIERLTKGIKDIVKLIESEGEVSKWKILNWLLHIMKTGQGNEELHCPVCGYYCLGKGGMGCIDKPSLVAAKPQKGE